MGIRNQEDLVTKYRFSLDKSSFSEKHALLSLLCTLQDITYRSVIASGEPENTVQVTGKFDFDTNYDKETPEKIIEFNKLFCDYFRDEVRSVFDTELDDIFLQTISAKFDQIKW